MFLKRLGFDPQANGVQCPGCQGCPDIWELEDGDFAIIGEDITAAVIEKLPATAGCAVTERIIRLPRRVLVNARQDIPHQV